MWIQHRRPRDDLRRDLLGFRGRAMFRRRALDVAGLSFVAFFGRADFLIEIPTALATFGIGSEPSADAFLPAKVFWVFIFGYMPLAGKVEGVVVFEESIAPERHVVGQVFRKTHVIEHTVADAVLGRKF